MYYIINHCDISDRTTKTFWYSFNILSIRYKLRKIIISTMWGRATAFWHIFKVSVRTYANRIFWYRITYSVTRSCNVIIPRSLSLFLSRDNERVRSNLPWEIRARIESRGSVRIMINEKNRYNVGKPCQGENDFCYRS